MNMNIKKFFVIFLAAVLSITAVTFIAETKSSASEAGGPASSSGNLLTNPDWENGLDGWTVLADSQEGQFGGYKALYSIVYQDVPVTGPMYGKRLKISGNIAVYPDDPTQETVIITMDIYGNNGRVLNTGSVKEQQSVLTYHEITMDIPAEAEFIRVSLEIRKQSGINQFNFSDLYLSITENKTEEENSFGRTPSEPQAEVPAETQPDVEEDTFTVTNLNIPSDAAYYNGHYYYYFDDPDGSWTDARSYCFIYDGHLVTITSAEEQAFLESQYPGTTGWTGAYLEDDEWKWTTGEAFSYTNWNSGEPNNQNGTEGYGHLYSGMKWNDLPEDDTTYHKGYYCEWDTDTVTYKKDGLFGGSISDETAKLVEEGKGYFYGTGSGGYDLDSAWNCFYDATDDYSGEAWYYLGRIMASGERSVKNPYLRALGSYGRAVTYGCQLGWIGMGDLYRMGLGVNTDYGKAMQYYQRAVSFGCAEGNARIGDLYIIGQGVAEDYSKALSYYQKAADSGDPYAMYMVGSMYEQGLGVGQDSATAVFWYEKALASPYLSIDIKESIGEEMAWLASEESAADYEYYEYTPAQDTSQYQNTGYDTSADYGYDYDYPQYETQPWESPYFTGYTQDGTPQYSYDTYEYETQPWESPYFTGYTQDGTPQYSYDTYEYETQPWESPYFIGYTQDGTPQYSYDMY